MHGQYSVGVAGPRPFKKPSFLRKLLQENSLQFLDDFFCIE